MAKQHHYTATAHRSGRWWNVLVDLPGGNTATTQGRDLVEAERMACDVVAVALGVDVSAVTVELTVSTSAEKVVARAIEAVEARNEAMRIADEAMRAAAFSLLSEGVTQRDAGRILGLSHQRISQLVA